MDFKSFCQKYASQWKAILCKVLPFVLVAVLSAATAFAILGMQGNQHKYTDAHGIDADLETRQQELQTALALTKDLLERLRVMESDALLIAQQTEAEKKAIDDKVEELKNILQNIENKEQQRWVLPMQYKQCSSYYGNREHPVSGESNFHTGVDLAGDLGTPIVAARSGTVKTAAYVENDAGYWVLIDHMDGYESAYMHMDRFIVTEGQFVLTGQVIGYCGSSGIATGNHLHFEIRKDMRTLNPADFIDIH